MKTQYSILFLLALVSSCMKERGVQLPEKTSRGAYTFGCMIDNDVFVARERCSYSVGLNLQTQCVTSSIDYYRQHILFIESRDDYWVNNQKIKIRFKVQLDSIEIKFIKLLSANLEIVNAQVVNSYSLDTLQNNAFTLDDALNRTVFYGTFTLYLKNNTGQMKILRDGRFDIEK